MNEGLGGVVWWGGLGLGCCGGVRWVWDGVSRLNGLPFPGKRGGVAEASLGPLHLAQLREDGRRDAR